MTKPTLESNGIVVTNTLEGAATVLAEVRGMVCKALDQAESRLLEARALEEEGHVGTKSDAA